MIRVQSNQSFRNVEKNALAGLELLQDSVFFGINGSGKTTVCEVLSRASKLQHDLSQSKDELQVFAFDEQWRRENVGEFVEGGSAASVVTVKLSKSAGNLDKKLHKAAKDLKSAQDALTRAEIEEETAKEQEDKVINDIFNGIRKSLEKRCSELSSYRFKRPAIRSLLMKGKPKVLSDEKVENLLSITETEAPGFLPALPHLPSLWTLSSELWDELTSTAPATEELLLELTDWIREGRELHQPGDSCQFCGETVTLERIDRIDAAIRQAEQEVSSFVMNELEQCSRSLWTIRDFKSSLTNLDFTGCIYGSDLPQLVTNVLHEITSVETVLEYTEGLLEERSKNPRKPIQDERPEFSYEDLEQAFSQLSKSHRKASKQVSQHNSNQKQAVEKLRSHCCAVNGANWSSVNTAFKKAQNDHDIAKSKLLVAERNLASLKKEVSTTADTAEFLDENLGIILGERILRVTEGAEGEGYLITRNDQKADGLSEGEKKLVSLLYFCAEFLTEERKQAMEQSMVIFDDLGSELDDARLMAIDRFISGHFTDPKPAALVYFTHSHSYLKLLQARLGDKASEKTKNGKTIPAKAIFYEVYKDSFNKKQQTTCYRQWDEEAVKLTNDYWLSFYMVLTGFERLLRGEYPMLGTGNYCRKVVEGFTEFRAPGNELFGSRLDELIKKAGLPLSPALSRILNGLSHTDLHRSGGVLSRNEMEVAVIQTLNLLMKADEDHFTSLLKKFRNKQQCHNIRSALEQRVGP